jgi:ribulose-5-phosphate 4-epimerase/fuculose-1-phosphate aldolase
VIDEGYIKYRSSWTKSAPPDFAVLDELCRWRSRLHQAGLIGHYENLGIGFGNLSARVGDGRQFLISGTQTGHIAASTRDQFSLVTRVDIEGNAVECQGPVQASSEAMTHASIYVADAAVNAVVHVHDAQLWATGLKTLPATAADTAYGTPAMAAELARLMKDPDFRACGIAAMAGHEEGLIAIGASVEQAALRILDFSSATRGDRQAQ